MSELKKIVRGFKGHRFLEDRVPHAGGTLGSFDRYLELTPVQEERLGQILEARKLQWPAFTSKEERQAAQDVVMGQIRAQLDPAQQQVFDRKYARLELMP